MLAFGDHHDRKAETPTIRLEINLKDANARGESVVVDFMHDAEDKYGFDVIHPEVKSAVIDLVGDDDNDDENDNNDDDIDLSASTNVANAQASNATSAPPPAPPKPKKRGRVEGKYDLDDPFIDDTEMLWEEQAASTKDGFFVYSGPLLQSAEPIAPKPDQTKKTASSSQVPIAPNGAPSNTSSNKPVKPRKKPGPVPGTRKKPKPKVPGTAGDSQGSGPSNAASTASSNVTNDTNGNSTTNLAVKADKDKDKVTKVISAKPDGQDGFKVPIVPNHEPSKLTTTNLESSSSSSIGTAPPAPQVAQTLIATEPSKASSKLKLISTLEDSGKLSSTPEDVTMDGQ